MFKAIYFEKSTEIMIPWLNDCHIHKQLYMLFEGNSKHTMVLLPYNMVLLLWKDEGLIQ